MSTFSNPSLTPEERAEINAEIAETRRRNPYSPGAALIEKERKRQMWAEGWTPEHDDEHTDGALIQAAKTYAEEARFRIANPSLPFDPTLALTSRDDHGLPASTWPWHADWWKPSDDPIRNLVKAGALIAAEIDRLQRRG